jgi:hypothetical protein
MSTEIVPTGIDRVDVAVRRWAASSLLPDHFKKDGVVKVADVIIAATTLDALDLDPVLNLSDVYVIHGNVGLMAELQRTLLARAGYGFKLVEATAESATVGIGREGGQVHLVTVTMAQAEKAGWTSSAMYTKMPERMLTARATTLAVSLYAPEVLRGMETAGVELDVPTQPANRPSPEDRALLRRALDELHPNTRAQLAADARGDGIPNIDGPRLTHLHRDRLAWLILAALDVPGPDETATDEPTPPDVHDDDPAVNGWDDADPGRPFDAA